MKWLLLVCAFLVQFFAAMPCSDEQVVAESTYSISSSCSDHHAPGADHCSPFCSCSCCGTSVAHYGEYGHDFFLAIFSGNDDQHKISRLCHIILPVWQPPQLL